MWYPGLGAIRSAIECVDGLSDELASGAVVDYKAIRFAGLEEVLAAIQDGAAS